VILDTSAVIAVILKQPGFEQILKKLAAADAGGIGAPSLAETAIVLRARLGIDPRGILARFLQEFRVTTVPFGEDHWREAVESFGRYGKGIHPASLNFGDCMSYAVAKLAQQPLLCVGEDFPQTDLDIA
jgi:ribonuclease VapC